MTSQADGLAKTEENELCSPDVRRKKNFQKTTKDDEIVLSDEYGRTEDFEENILV